MVVEQGVHPNPGPRIAKSLGRSALVLTLLSIMSGFAEAGLTTHVGGHGIDVFNSTVARTAPSGIVHGQAYPSFESIHETRLMELEPPWVFQDGRCVARQWNADVRSSSAGIRRGALPGAGHRQVYPSFESFFETRLLDAESLWVCPGRRCDEDSRRAGGLLHGGACGQVYQSFESFPVTRLLDADPPRAYPGNRRPERRWSMSIPTGAADDLDVRDVDPSLQRGPLPGDGHGLVHPPFESFPVTRLMGAEPPWLFPGGRHGDGAAAGPGELGLDLGPHVDSFDLAHDSNGDTDHEPDLWTPPTGSHGTTPTPCTTTCGTTSCGSSVHTLTTVADPYGATLQYDTVKQLNDNNHFPRNEASCCNRNTAVAMAAVIAFVFLMFRRRARSRHAPGTKCGGCNRATRRTIFSAARAGRGQPRRYDPRMRRAARYTRSRRRESSRRSYSDVGSEGRGCPAHCGCEKGSDRHVANCQRRVVLGNGLDDIKRARRHDLNLHWNDLMKYVRSVQRLRVGAESKPPSPAGGDGHDPDSFSKDSLRRGMPSSTRASKGVASGRRRIPKARICMARYGLLRTVCFLAAMAGRAWATSASAGPATSQPPAARRSWNMLAKPEMISPSVDNVPQERIPLDEPRGSDQRDDYTSIISANIHALGPRIGEVSQWDADILLLQETKLAAHSIKDAAEVAKQAGWTLLHGRPCRVSTRRDRKNGSNGNGAATEANSGGVATMVRKPRRDLGHKMTEEEAALHDTGRWTKATTAVNRGGGVLTTACVYGVSGANSCKRAHKHNEVLLAQAIKLLIEAGDQPYILMGDFNVTPSLSPAITAAVNAGLAIDIGHLFSEQVDVDDNGDAIKLPEPTFDKKGPLPGMSGPGVSRIDIALANPAAISAVRAFHLRWDLVQVDHVPIQILLDMGRLDAVDIAHRTRGDVCTKGVPAEHDDKWDDAYHRAHAMFGPRLQAALDAEDIDEAHTQWSYFAEACIELAKGKDEQQVQRLLDSSPPERGPSSVHDQNEAETSRSPRPSYNFPATPGYQHHEQDDRGEKQAETICGC